jgi:ketosteroid isomerase-like protein
MTSEPTAVQVSDVESIVRRYYGVVADLSSGTDDLQPLLAPDLRVTEHPNPISPNGGVRDREATIQGFLAGKSLLREQSFDVHEIVVAGDRAAARLTWRGVVGIDAGPLVAGQELVAEIASFLTVRDGQVVEQETFDCYRPFAR